MSGKRVTYLEAIRGAACILLVSWHVIGDVASLDGLRLPPEHPLHLLSPIFLPLRMPLFAFISGFVFTTIARDWSAAGATLATKARRLLVPMAVVGTLHFLLQSLMYHHNPLDIWKIYVGSYEHFWFLQASFLIIAIALAVSILARGDVRKAAIVCLVISLPFYGWEFELQPVNWFSFSRIFYLAPFFFLGQAFYHLGAAKFFHTTSRERTAVVVALGLTIAALYWVFLGGHELLGEGFTRRSYPTLLLSLLSCIFIFSLRIENRFLAWIGGYTYAIFLFHVIFTAGTRVFGRDVLGLTNPYFEWIVGLTVGIGAPIIIVELLKRGPSIFEVLLLGVRYRRAPKPVAGDFQAAGAGSGNA